MDRSLIADIYPLSPAQQGILFHALLSPGADVYRRQVSYEIAAALDAAAFTRAWQAVVDRHAALRTAFAWEGRDDPRQVVFRQVKLPVERLDWCDLPPGERQTRLAELLAADRARPFRLSKAPLARLLLVALGPERWCCIWTYHHLLLDGWSLSQIRQEVAALYAAAREGRPAQLPQCRQFGDYVAWLGRQDRAAAEAFWRRELAGFSAPTPLGIERLAPGPAVAAGAGGAGTEGAGAIPATAPAHGELDHRLPADLTAALRTLQAAHGLTFSTLIYGAWALLLSRYGGASDVLFGAVFSGRPASLPGVESIVGMMINTLPLRVRVARDLPLVALLRQLQRQRIELHAYEHSSLAEVQRWSEVRGGGALFDSLVIFENFPGRPLGGGAAAPSLAVSGVRSIEATHYPLTLLAEMEEGLHLRLAFAAGRFDTPAMMRLLRHLAVLLEASCAGIERPADELVLLTAAERQQLLAEWSDTAAAAPPAATADRLFARQAALTPGAVAVTGDQGAWTYAELGRRAGRLARRLRALGAGPEVLVGVYAESSPEAVAGLLAVLAAGAAYVPLDPEYPRERLAFMIADSGLRLLLTQRRLLDALPAPGLPVLVLDEDGDDDAGAAAWGAVHGAPADQCAARHADGLAVSAADPDGLAYVIYTSGSTGKPKGVQVPHRALANFLWSLRARLGVGPGSRLAAVTSLSFDIAGLELFLPLVAGGEVLPVGREVVRDGGRLLSLLRGRRIDLMQATPATWRLLIEAGWEQACAEGSVRLEALCGGEALAAELARRLAAGGGPVWNLYGPTETTIWSAVHRAGDERGGWVPIGRPIGNTELYCLDGELRPLPIGVAGELYIGGAGLARGYLRRPELTAERFVPHPYAARPGGRLYRTGDLVRLLPGGEVEFLGRCDHQVKVRGFRIELGEIEAALRACEGVREAVVARREEGGDSRLVAYLVVDPATAPVDGELRARLRQRLPEWMVPAALVRLAALPLTPNGKVDRRALPAPAAGRDDAPPPESLPAAAAAAGEAPAAGRGELEKAIAAIWAEVLGTDRVRPDDHFFDLGGHSLLMMRVHRRLCERLGCDIALVDLFRFPTVAALARFLAPPSAAARAGEPAPRGAPAGTAAGGPAAPAIAIIGMAGRFPGARDTGELWANLRDGVSGISFFGDEELLAAGVAPALVANPRYVKAKGVLADGEGFDAAFFGFVQHDAELLDPQHRIFLECAWEALESAGHAAGTFAGRVGVYAGASMNTYWPYLPVETSAGAYQAMIGNDKDFLPTRVSYKLDLHGPSVGVQTACSTSLVAVHMACQSLRWGECDMALAGGVSLTFPRLAGYLYSDGMIASPDGHCRAFDERAGGTVSGEGVGAVVLRRLADAVADGDPILAVIRGSAVNNDGADKVSYAAPSVSGQAEVIAAALEMAGFPAESVSYVEAHGTGTPLGDPIEVAALTQAYAARSPRRGSCALGSIKASIGHLDAAAGIAGLIKTVLSLRHGALPPSLHFTRPNPQIDFAAGPFFVNSELREWRGDGTPRRAGVSSFGIGGTNAHVLIEEAPVTASPAAGAVPAAAGDHLLVLSARTPAALEAATDRLAGFLASGPGIDLTDVAFTLQRGRRAFEHRRMLVCRDPADAAAALAARAAGRVLTGVWEGGERPVAAMFPGQGAQRAGMGRELYLREPAFREAFDRCADLLGSHLECDLRSLLYADAEPQPGAAAGAAPGPAAEARLQETALAQPALFAVEYSLAALWCHWGVRPQALIGHSLGEYVAACLAGVFTLEDALALLAARGRLMQQLPPGAMLDVALSEGELGPALAALDDDASTAGLHGSGPGVPGLAIAALNAPRRTVVAGPAAAVAALERSLRERSVRCKLLHTAHAFHSPAVEPLLAPFRECLRGIALAPPRLRFVSNVTGTWVRPEEATDPEYWVRQLRAPVRFADGVTALLEHADAVLLELGPGETLTGLVRQRANAAGRLALSALPARAGAAASSPLEPLGRLWLAGVPVDWAGAGRPGRRLALPTYPFERRRFSLVAARPAPFAAAPAGVPARPADVPTAGRLRQLRVAVFEVVRKVSGLNPEEAPPGASFVEMGIDSLLLIQFSEALQAELGVRLSVTQLLEEVTTLDGVVGWLARGLPAEAGTAAPRSAAADAPPGAAQPPAAPDLLSPAATALPSSAAAAPALAVPVNGFEGGAVPAPEVFVAHQPIEPGAAEPLPARQRQALDALVEGYTARTRESKRRAAAGRRVLADNRNSVDFRLHWKEMVYPIVGESSAGSRFTDIDGNSYVDLAMGFGVNLFGHSPDFVTAAVAEQLARGIQIGPQSNLAGEVAEGIAALTGMERITFSNTGTEAVMTALRVARAVTGRHKVALFAGSYHGSFDGVLARPGSGEGAVRALPLAPGVPPHLVADLLVLPYGEEAALDLLRAAGRDLAAVLVEPVQSRRPDFQPQAFLRELRRLTRELGAALVFDEVITGFRVHPGGAQAWFGVEADLATYGKILGGGMPIGVVAGRAGYLDAIDGGAWQFGDLSYPSAGKTFFAGTFCKHPLAMAAARAVVRRLRDSGPGLQRGLNARTAALAERLNGWFAAEGLPIRVAHFGSLFRFVLSSRLPFESLFFFHLVNRGVFCWEGRTCFLSTAHSDEDVEEVVAAVQASALALRQGGFLPEAPRPPAAAAMAVGAAVPSPAPAASGAGPLVPPGAAAPLYTLPPTDGQRQLWFLAQLGDPSSRAYNESKTLELGGPLARAPLRRALQWAHDRHDALRTTFAADGELARVAAPAPRPLPEVDLEALASPRREALAAGLLRREAGRCFDLERGPLLRALLLRLSARRHLLVLTCHHIILDGRSLGRLVRELASGYATALAAPATLAEQAPPAAPAELATRQERRGAEGAAARALAYWQAQLASGPPPLELPCDHPRPAVHSYRGGLRVRRAGGLCAPLRELGAGHGATLFMTLLAAIGAWLHRLAGQDDLVVGFPSAGSAPGGGDGRRFLGYDLNLLPLRSQVGGNPTFADHLAAVRRRVLAGNEHRDFSFNALLKALGLRYGLGRLPLVAVAFNLDRDEPGARFADLELTLHGNTTGGSRFELFLNAVERGGELLLECEHSSDLFEALSVDRFLAHLETLLRAAAAAPLGPVLDLPLLSAGERHQILHAWNDTAAEYDRDRLIHHLFSAQVARDPEPVAAVCAGESLSYGELNRQANRLAHLLRALGVRRGDPIALFLPRDLAMVVAVLGVLKAGAAYVPLAGSFPPARRRWIAAALGIRYLVTHPDRLGELLGPPAQIPGLEHLVCLPAGAGAAAATAAAATADASGDAGCRLWGAPDLLRQPQHDPPDRGDAGDTAYVIFTSGSTGTPKGVVVAHRAVVNLIVWVNRTFEVGAGDRVLFITSLSFDLSVYDVFGLLAAGGSIEIATDADLAEPERLYRLLRSRPITFWDSAPAALQQLTPYFAPPPGEPEARLRLVFLSGDWVPLTLPAEVWHTFGRARVIALGGATEATVWSNFHVVTAVDPRWSSIPYGRPIQNAVYHVLDLEFEPCPVGVAGDLHIGGECLASGYAEPALTAERFLPDSHAAVPGSRLYKTGDCARRWPDGTLEFLGRRDSQIKVRGFRIELGEIEATLAQHPAVRHAAAVVRHDRPGQQQLVAYVVLQPPGAAAGELLDWLAQRLPAYMVPGAIVTLDVLPVTANGKLNRAALPAPPSPDGGGDGRRQSRVPPRNPREQVLAEIWAELLGLPSVGVHDRFVDLGGDSILSIQVVARANRAGVRITARQLYEVQTIAALAALAGAAGTAAVAAEQGPVSGEVPLTPTALWLLSQELADLHHFNQSLLLESAGAFDPAAAGAVAAVVAALVAHHDALRLRLEETAARWRQRFAPLDPAGAAGPPGDGRRCFHQVDLAGLPEPARWAAMVAACSDLRRSLDLQAGPVLRVALFTAAPSQPARLLLVIHHLAVDGISWRVLLDDLEAAYGAALSGAAPALPPKTSSFKRWAEHLQVRASAPEALREAAYWLDRPARPREMPRDRAGANLVASQRRAEESLSAVETRELLQEVPAAYRTTIDDALLTALAQTLTAWAGGDGVLVDLEGHGREHEADAELDLSRTVGWFTAIYPVYLRTAEKDPGAALRAVKEQLRAVPGRGLGYGLLRYLAPDAATATALGKLPAAEVSFNYLGQVDRVLRASAPFRDARPAAGTVRAADGAAGGDRSPRQRRRYLLEVNAHVSGGCLRVAWTYSAAAHDGATVATLAQGFAGALRALIAHCRSPLAGSFTPSDFPLARLDEGGAERLRERLATALATTAPAAARAVEDLYPLSPLQEGMLVHALTARGSHAGVEQMSCRLDGELDVAAFAGAWQRLLGRHASLRTLFVAEGLQRSLQAVCRRVPLTVAVEDWRGLPPPAQEARLDRLLRRDRERGFRLDRAPLLRFTLIRRGPHAWQLVWTHHHLILDGWCRAQVLQELLALYAACHAGAEPAVVPSPPFRDYIAWLQRHERADDEAFWRRAFAGFRAPGVLDLARPEETAALARGYDRRELRLPAAATGRLLDFARHRGLTPGTLVQAAWALLLGRYAGSEEVVYGLTVAGRPPDLPGVEQMIGMFINNLPVPVRLQEGEEIGAWLRRLQDWQQELRQHEHSAAAQVHEWSGLPLGRRLFDTLVVFQNYPLAPAAAPARAEEPLRPGAPATGPARASLDLSLHSYSLETGYPLTLVVDPGDELTLTLGYQRRRLDAAAVERALSHLAALLAALAGTAAAGDPPRRLGDLPLLTPAERRQLAGAAGGGGPAPPPPPPGERRQIPPRNAHELELVRLWEDLFAVSPIGVRDDFFDLGGHSLLAVRLITAIRSRFGCELPLSALFAEPTIEHLADLLRQGGAAAAASGPLVALNRGASRLPLFLVHPAGGGALIYVELARHLGAEQPVYCLQMPEHQPPRHVEEMAARYLQLVREAQPRGPYRLGGSSFGGYVAFEMAQQLHAAGETVGLVALLDTEHAAAAAEPDPKTYLDHLLREMLPADELELPAASTLDEQLAASLALLHRHDFVTADFTLADLRRYFERYWINIMAAHRYRPGPFAGRLTLFRARDRTDLPAEILRDPTLGWGILAAGGVELHEVPGSHFNLTQPPHVAVLAERLRGCLERLPEDLGREGTGRLRQASEPAWQAGPAGALDLAAARQDTASGATHTTGRDS
jgi:amino acid adenylation domain-containing protein/non-ribosomal peptide synthase protein (TIGR01720 family)